MITVCGYLQTVSLMIKETFFYLNSLTGKSKMIQAPKLEINDIST